MIPSLISIGVRVLVLVLFERRGFEAVRFKFQLRLLLLSFICLFEKPSTGWQFSPKWSKSVFQSVSALQTPLKSEQ